MFHLPQQVDYAANLKGSGIIGPHSIPSLVHAAGEFLGIPLCCREPTYFALDMEKNHFLVASDSTAMEDGEIDNTGVAYDSSLEWPAESSTNSFPNLDGVQGHPNRSSHAKPASWVTMRLLVTKTSILPRKHRLAVVDGYPQLQFGRDVAPTGTDIPRIRLKEMEVSKIHAAAYWDSARTEWAVVDMGSKHGTFLTIAGASVDSSDSEKGVRLSLAKTTSVPRRLHHLDLLTIGSTTFQIHIHGDQVPCVECSPKGGDEIPLFPATRVQGELKRAQDTAGMEAGVARTRDPKKALAMLKRTLLTQHDDDGWLGLSAEGETRYRDRSARRRELRPASRPDTPGLRTPTFDIESGPLPRPSIPPKTAEIIRPLPITNIGHRLLVKQGWRPGTSLGLPGEQVGLVEPLELGSNKNRTGLGVTKR